MAIALALERYRAIRHPIQYHNANAGTNPWKKAFTNYLGPVIGFSVITNLPKFLEFEALYQENIHDTYNPELNTITKMKVVEAVIYPTDLRFNHKYVLWYKNVTRLLLTGLIPFVVLVYLNFSVFSVIRRRRHLEHRFIKVQSTALKAEAAKQAYVLFAICTTFLFGHILRVVLNIHEFYTLDQVLDGMDNDCFTVKFWTLVTGNVSHLLLTINSSMNILIYCLMSGDFR
ncbi:hypothetical protein TCAL_03327 [Tigriopus californicus]|uniref:G-protein coupled receptors family 1 profile domain-containing protein n=2 Tax=Tigriopus californicus TaxID=6832 RepID=A0A553P7G2_TIGCA|nr:hypothetical protein TCAL_03327 [Tigriopus californicus]|eukprot:TCALIF_03327-PA protein Name:"Similar to FR FMRFamide receptor (Drosophila melanogaster)" AED:0.10 eAED:0.10 QI:175/1/0.25/1/1/1/4/0/229